MNSMCFDWIKILLRLIIQLDILRFFHLNFSSIFKKIIFKKEKLENGIVVAYRFSKLKNTVTFFWLQI